MEVTENMLLQYKNEKIIRVVYCDRLTSIIYAVDMRKMRWPFIITKEELISLRNEGLINVLDDDPFFRPVEEEELSLAQKNKREQAWKIVSLIYKLVESEVLIFRSKYREEAIRIAQNSYPVNYTTIKNYLIRYWQGGKIKNGLLPHFHLCGAKGKERAISDKKRGRPRENGPNQGVNIDNTIRKYFQIGLNRYYYNERQNSLKTTYELIIKDFFTVKVEDHKGKKIPVIKDHSQLPTYNQFLYWYRKMNDPKKELIKRKGTRNYFQNYRTIIGDSTQDAGLGPGNLWQVDATPFDIYLVSSTNRNIIVGRPTLYLVIDVYSRYIVGMNISFEPFNSYTGVMVALANSMTPKEDYCKQYGISLDKGDWDVACVPQRVFADRGELNGRQIEEAIANLGIIVQNAPAFRPDKKGIIEQAFEQMNMKIKPFADGIVKNGRTVVERGDQEYRLKANLTLDEFAKIIIKCVLYHNNHHVLSQYVLDEMMLADEVEKIPTKIWEHGLKTMKGQLRTLPENTIKMHLLPTENASVTSRGVRFKKMLYSSSYSLKNGWYQDARINGSRRLKIWYDPRDLSHIYVINEDGEFHKLTLLDHLAKFKNKGIDEVNKIIEFEEVSDHKSKEKELQEKLKLFNDIEEIVEQGRRATLIEKDASLSKTKRLKGIRDNQKMERELQRELIKKENEPLQEDKITFTEANTWEEQNDELDMFKMIQKLDWGDGDE